jgi:TrmH family RNA methyltransferase
MITSPSNPEVRSVAALHKRSERELTGLFLIEGRPEVERAVAAGIEINTVYRLTGSDPLALPGNPRTVELGEMAFQKLAYGRDGIVATAVAPMFALEDLVLGEPALVLAVEAIEKPGNLGAILRSADGAGASMIVANPVTDMVNPNVVRASVGSLFTVPLAVATSEETIAYLKKRSISICSAMVGTGRAPWELDLTGPLAIVVGSEHTGLSLPWRQAADHEVTLPLSGTADSLNASVAAAVILFETIRQRSSPRTSWA